ncbi:MBL fold metallo-hydrolase [Roseobacter sp. N2S]|uniref:MBL fold metallo-hydrolase n=1 Tax=Roseobacter sp. N2S TaxID=2663844 RepID=UPI00285B6658|nr:MBL fold metallo-hydrolase [Roseobacter sp. N2S]MDR6263722.1 L-ascorbate metabolism protein UlaG (beta-lactamase superfamily) [Roseobacter sp. N2S]
MTQSRRGFLKTGVAASGVVFLPYVVGAAAHGGDEFPMNGGAVSVHPVAHASVVLETPVGTIYVDPVGEVAQYADLPKPDLILITHHHGDHFNVDTLKGLVAENTPLITNPEVMGMLPDELKTNASQLANGESSAFNGVSIDAIPAYNTTEDRAQFHPKGRDNGYVLGFDGLRVYISGDTEDIPDMRALKDIDVAFVCMNLPFTMDIEAAASAVAEFKPKYVYPYHYRGRDDGTQDPAEFAKLIGDAVEVKMGNWYS